MTNGIDAIKRKKRINNLTKKEKIALNELKEDTLIIMKKSQ